MWRVSAAPVPSLNGLKLKCCLEGRAWSCVEGLCGGLFMESVSAVWRVVHGVVWRIVHGICECCVEGRAWSCFEGLCGGLLMESVGAVWRVCADYICPRSRMALENYWMSGS